MSYDVRDDPIYKELLRKEEEKDKMREALLKEQPVCSVGRWTREVFGIIYPNDRLKEISDRLREIIEDEEIKIFGEDVPNPDYIMVFPTWLLEREEKLFEIEE